MISPLRKVSTYTNLICLGNAFCNADNQPNLVLDSFNDCVSSGGRRDVEDGSVGLRRVYSLSILFNSREKIWDKNRRTARTVPNIGNPR